MQASVSSVFNRVLGLSAERYSVTLTYHPLDQPLVLPVSPSPRQWSSATPPRQYNAESTSPSNSGLSNGPNAASANVETSQQSTAHYSSITDGSPALPSCTQEGTDGPHPPPIVHTMEFSWTGNESEVMVLERFLQLKADFLREAVKEEVKLTLHPADTTHTVSCSQNTGHTTPHTLDNAKGNQTVAGHEPVTTGISPTQTNNSVAPNAIASVPIPVAISPITSPFADASIQHPTKSSNTAEHDIASSSFAPLRVSLSLVRHDLTLRSLSFSRPSPSGSVSAPTLTALLRHCELSSVTHLAFYDGYGTACTRGIELLTWTSLSVLHLAGCGLTQLPELKGLSGLRELHVPSNKLAALPLDMSKLTQLSVLRADNNTLSALPGEIRCLKELRHLSLTNNKLPSLPLSLTSFPQLQTLDLRSNTLMTQIPDLRWGVAPNLTLLGFANFIIRASSTDYEDCEVQLYGTVPNTSREVQLGPLLRQVVGQGAGVHPLLSGALVGLSRDLGDAGVMAGNESVVQQLMDMAMSVEPVVVEQANRVIDVIARNPEVTSKLSRSNLSGLRTILLLSTGPDHALRSRSPTLPKQRRLRSNEPLSRSLPSDLPTNWTPRSNSITSAGLSRLNPSASTPPPNAGTQNATTSSSQNSSQASDPRPAHSRPPTAHSPSPASSILSGTLLYGTSPSSLSHSNSNDALNTLPGSVGASTATPLLASPVTTPPTSPRHPLSNTPPTHTLPKPLFRNPSASTSHPKDLPHKGSLPPFTPSATGGSGDRPPLPTGPTALESQGLHINVTKQLRSSSAPPAQGLLGTSSIGGSPAATPTGTASNQGWATSSGVGTSRIRRVSEQPFKEQRRAQQARHRAACCVEMVRSYGEAMEATMQVVAAEGAMLTACNKVAEDKFGDLLDMGMAMVAFTGELKRKEKNLVNTLTLLETIDTKLEQLENTMNRIDTASQDLAKTLGVREDADSYVSQFTNPSSYSLTNLRNFVPIGNMGSSPAK